MHEFASYWTNLVLAYITTRIRTTLDSLVLSYITSLSDSALPHSSLSPRFDYQIFQVVAACSAHGPPPATSPCIAHHLLPSWSRLSIVAACASPLLIVASDVGVVEADSKAPFYH
jgi:hypothetical protein